MEQPLTELARALARIGDPARSSVTPSDTGLEPVVRPDHDRERRKGVPEVIYAEAKLPEHVVASCRAFLERRGRAILSRVPAELRDRLRAEFADHDIVEYPAARAVVIRRPGYVLPATGGSVGIITAGTSDIPVAQEAKAILIEMGCEVREIFDVGVAGLHRLIEPLNELLAARVDVVIVAAGMDGALPSVVAGLVDTPVIGLPTSTGYGHGGKGEGALTTMLQSCSPGIAVVNIDNGVGAAATAGLIANRAAAARRSVGSRAGTPA